MKISKNQVKKLSLAKTISDERDRWMDVFLPNRAESLTELILSDVFLSMGELSCKLDCVQTLSLVECAATTFNDDELVKLITLCSSSLQQLKVVTHTRKNPGLNFNKLNVSLHALKILDIKV